MTDTFSNTFAFVFLAGMLGTGVLVWDQMLSSTTVSADSQSQFDTVQQLLTTGGDLFGPLAFVAGIAIVLAVAAGRL